MPTQRKRDDGSAMPYADLDGLRLYYEREGGGERELLFIHGWCCDLTAFQPQFGHFAGTYAVTALDLVAAAGATAPRTGTRSPPWQTTSRDSARRSGSTSRSSSGTASAG